MTVAKLKCNYNYNCSDSPNLTVFNFLLNYQLNTLN